MSTIVHKFSGFWDLYNELLQTGSVVCASPLIRAKIYKELERTGTRHRTEFVQKNTDMVNGSKRPDPNRNFSYDQIAKLIRGGRLTLEGLRSSIKSFEDDTHEYKKYRVYKRFDQLWKVLRDHEYLYMYSQIDYTPVFQDGLTEKEIAHKFKRLNPLPNLTFFPLCYARLVKSTKRIVIV